MIHLTKAIKTEETDLQSNNSFLGNATCHEFFFLIF